MSRETRCAPASALYRTGDAAGTHGAVGDDRSTVRGLLRSVVHHRPAPRPARRGGTVDERRAMTTLARTVAQLEPALPADLVSPQAVAAISATAQWLPAAVTRRLYFECRLAEASPQVDLIVALDAADRTTVVEERSWQQALAATPPWAGVFEFGRRWAAPAGAFSGSDKVWLEFDVRRPPGNAAPPPVPGIFVTRPAVRGRDAGRIDEQLEALAVIRGTAVPDGTVRACRDLLARLPESARLTHIGVMYSRDPNTVRLCVGPSGRASLPWLQAIGWSGDLDAVAQTLDAVTGSTLADVTLAHVDVRDGQVMPRLGFELPFDDSFQRRGITREIDLLDRLCTLGLASRAKVSACVTWPGSGRIWLAQRQAMQPVVRRLSNLKLVWNGAASPEVKVYLSAFHQ